MKPPDSGALALLARVGLALELHANGHPDHEAGQVMCATTAILTGRTSPTGEVTRTDTDALGGQRGDLAAELSAALAAELLAADVPPPRVPGVVAVVLRVVGPVLAETRRVQVSPRGEYPDWGHGEA